MNIFKGSFVLHNTVPVFNRGMNLAKNIVVVTKLTIISLEVCLKGMDAREDWMRSLMVRLNRSISGTCYFLDTQFRDMPRSTISAHSGSNSLSV